MRTKIKNIVIFIVSVLLLFFFFKYYKKNKTIIGRITLPTQNFIANISFFIVNNIIFNYYKRLYIRAIRYLPMWSILMIIFIIVVYGKKKKLFKIKINKIIPKFNYVIKNIRWISYIIHYKWDINKT